MSQDRLEEIRGRWAPWGACLYFDTKLPTKTALPDLLWLIKEVDRLWGSVVQLEGQKEELEELLVEAQANVDY